MRDWCERAAGRSASGSVKVTRKDGTGKRRTRCCSSQRVASSFWLLDEAQRHGGRQQMGGPRVA